MRFAVMDGSSVITVLSLRLIVALSETRTPGSENHF